MFSSSTLFKFNKNKTVAIIQWIVANKTILNVLKWNILPCKTFLENMLQIFANIFTLGWNEMKIFVLPWVETHLWHQFFQPRWILKISQWGDISYVTVLLTCLQCYKNAHLYKIFNFISANFNFVSEHIYNFDSYMKIRCKNYIFAI